MAELLQSQAPSPRSDTVAADVAEPALADAAERTAHRAADRAGCTIRSLHDLTELAATAAVFSEIWSRADGEQILPLELLRALTHAGNYAAGAHVDGRLVGAIVGFFGEHDGDRTLHSHIMGLLPAARGHGIGNALKQHQRAWALAHGITEVTWTFDPLVRANAHLNIAKLGGVAGTYLPDFYGPMTDALNAGAGSDRLLVTWRLDTARTQAASEGRAPRWDHRDLVEAGAEVVLAEDTDGRPTAASGRADRLLCQVPADIIGLRSSRPDVARDWRTAVRDALGGALDGDHLATGFTRDGFYVMERAHAEVSA